MIHAFIQKTGHAFEQLGGQQYRIAVTEIGTKFDPAWDKNDAAQRAKEAVVRPFQVALELDAQPRVLAIFGAEQKKKDGVEFVAHGGKPDVEEQIHFLEVGRQVFTVASYQHGQHDTEFRLYPPIRGRVPDAEALNEKGWKGLYDADRGDVPVVRLFRKKGQRTDVQFGKGKVHEDQAFGWAMYEALASALRRGNLGGGQDLDAGALSAARNYGWVSEWLKGGRQVGFSALLPLLANAKGTLLPDGPPTAGILLHAFDWNGKTVTVTQDVGPKPRVRAFLRDMVGEQPSWVELRFPANAEVPTRGVSAVLHNNRVRIFGGADDAGAGLTSEWVFDLAQGGNRAYLESTFRPGVGLDEPNAFGTSVAHERGVLQLGGLEAFVASRGKKVEALPQWRQKLALQPVGQAGWRPAGQLPEGMSSGGSTFVVNGGFFLGPGAGLDGRLAYVDTDDRLAIELPMLPGRFGLGQLHLDRSVLYYSGGYRHEGDRAVASETVLAIDLNQLEGWKVLGECPILAGSNRLLHRAGRPIVLGLSPKGRFTFVPRGGGLMLLHADELRPRLERLAADVGALGTAAGLGFVSSDRGLANAAIKTLAAGPWAFLDLRAVEPSRAEGLLVDVLSAAPKQLLLVTHRDPPAVAARVIKAYIDRAPQLLLGARLLQRPAGGALLIVVDGANNLVGLPEPLPTVAYWDFVP